VLVNENTRASSWGTSSGTNRGTGSVKWPFTGLCSGARVLYDNVISGSGMLIWAVQAQEPKQISQQSCWRYGSASRI
jgi:hypothetical protein